ncbi:hypothetical protein J437_LFUL009914 [Ladona fulva]|uniref:Uncharacterized protein n=1 Tax=Ladona fulva TaxID=123851 RepID=A0A8K0K137_LADFU|nr:hypothetical protein J437_LFUL009914 [Ladona fulva]
MIPLWILCHSYREVEKLTVKKKYIDFGICVAGGVYQDCLEVYNGYEYARGVTLIINRFSKPHMKHIKNLISPHVVEVIPKGVTFVQPHSFYPFIVRLFVREVEKLTVKKKYIDFGICVAGGVYQDCLEVYNGYEYARGVTLIINRFSKPHMKHIKNLISPHVVEVIPKGVTFVQPHSFYPFIVRLFVRKSEESLNADFGQGNNSNENLIFDVKLYTSIHRSETHGTTESLTKHLICRIPAFASLSDVAANLKCHPLILDPPILNLGRCLTTETIKANFKIISNSRITLTYGFLNLPQANPDFTIYAAMKVEVTVIHIPDIQLSCSLVCFPATTCGSLSMASFLLSSTKGLPPKVKAGVQEKLQSQNTKCGENAEYCYEFLSQADDILVYPQQGYLKLGQKKKKDKKKKNTPAIKSKIPSLNETETNAEIILLKEFQPYVMQSKIACLVGKNQKEEESRSRKSPEVIFIDVVCPVICPGFLILECEELNLLNQRSISIICNFDCIERVAS